MNHKLILPVLLLLLIGTACTTATGNSGSYAEGLRAGHSDAVCDIWLYSIEVEFSEFNDKNAAFAEMLMAQDLARQYGLTLLEKLLDDFITGWLDGIAQLYDTAGDRLQGVCL